MTKRVKVDTRAITKALTALEKEVSKASPGALAEIAEEAKDFAVDEFAAAEYDGENDVVVDIRQYKNGLYVVARGKSLYFIEYGTGANRDYWYFSGEGKDVELTATGREYERRQVTSKTKLVDEYIVRVQDGVDEEFPLPRKFYDDVKRGRAGWFIDYKGARLLLSNREKRVPRSQNPEDQDYVDRNPVYNTEGNPANDVMTRTREYMNEIYPEIIRRHIKRLSK